MERAREEEREREMWVGGWGGTKNCIFRRVYKWSSHLRSMHCSISRSLTTTHMQTKHREKSENERSKGIEFLTLYDRWWSISVVQWMAHLTLQCTVNR